MYLLICERNPNSLEKLLNVGNDGPKHGGASRATSFLQERGGAVRAFLFRFCGAPAQPGSRQTRHYSAAMLRTCLSLPACHSSCTRTAGSCGLSMATGTVHGAWEGAGDGSCELRVSGSLLGLSHGRGPT